MSDVRPVWLTEDDALLYGLISRWRSAPADPMQTAIDAYIHYAGDMPIVWEILVAIGYPSTEENMRRALGVPEE